MEKMIGKEFANAAQREAFLKDNCDAVENKGYMKQFTPEQLQGHKEKLANLSIKLSEVENEKRQSDVYFKSIMKPLKEQVDEVIHNIKQKSEYIEEVCYKFTDQEAKETGFYNADGDLIECRPATADELQATIFSIVRKNGTEDK